MHNLLNEDDMFDWTKGPAAGSPLPQDIMQLLDHIVFPYYYKLFDEEEKKTVVERVLGNMRELTEDYGPGIYLNQMEQTTKYMNLFL